MPRLIDHQAREEAIVEAAWRVLVRDGAAAVSVRNVAAEADLATASLRRAFPSQSDLLVACLTLMGTRAEARIRALRPRPDAVAMAMAQLGETMPLDDQRRVEMKVYVVLGIAALSDPALRAAHQRIDAGIERLCASVVASLSPSAPRSERSRATRHLHALLDGLALHLLHGMSPRAATNTLRDYVVSLAKA